MKALSRLWHENWKTIAVAVVLVAAYFALRSSPSEISSAEAFVASLQQGEPTVVLFYSNF